MADDSNNPQDNFAYRELLRAQKESSDEIAAVNRAIGDLSKQVAGRNEPKRTPTPQGGAQRVAGTGRRSAGDLVLPKTTGDVSSLSEEERAARNAEGRSAARTERLTREQARLTAAFRREAIERQRIARLGVGGALDIGRTQLPESRGSRSAGDVANRQAIRQSGERIAAAKREERAQRALQNVEQNRRAQLLLPPARSIQLGPAGSTPLHPSELGYQHAGGTGGLPPRNPLPAGAIGSQQRNFRDAIAQPPPARIPPPPTEAEIAAQQRLIAQERTLAQARVQAASAGAAERRAIQETARAVGLSGDQFQRHGYLTSEFIQAAAKGQVTIRELGTQVGGTIGKFAGWTAAATAVYAAAGAISTLGSGAVDSLTGVAKLNRVVTGINTDQAQQQFRDLSREFNLPIDVVTEAAFEAARVFKDQDDIFAATKTTLGAVSVAELKAGDAGTYLNAIYRGLGGTAQDLAGTLDAANNITNKFGGNTGQLVEGTAKAAASFKAASKEGEGYADLLALVSTTQLATGISGAQAGTIIKRGAQNSQKPANRAALEELLPGVTAETSFIDLITRAQKEFQKNGISAAKKGEIAKQIFTPNLAAAGGQALLQSPQILANNLAAAQPGARKDSVKNEVEKKLASISEQAKKVAIELGALGSALGESGALTAAGGLLKGLTAALHLATSLVEQFDKLPSGVRTSLILFAELKGILAVIRRLDAGQAIEGRFPALGQFLRRDPAKLERAQTLSGIGQQKTSIVEESNRVQKQRLTNAYSTASAHNRVEAAVGRGDPDEILHAQNRLLTLQEQGRNLTAEGEDLAAQHAAVQHQENEFTRRTTKIRKGGLEEQRNVARSLGIAYTNPTLDQKSHLRPIALVAPLEGPAREGAGPGEVGTGAVGAIAATSITTQGERYVRAQNSLRENIAKQRRITSQFFPNEQRLASVLGTAAGGIATGGKAVANTAKGFADLSRDLIDSLGPLELIGLGAVAAYGSYEFVQRQLKETNAQVNRLASIHAEAPKKLIQRGNKELGQKSLVDRYQSLVGGVSDFANDPFGIIGQPVLLGKSFTPNQARDSAARDSIATGRTIAAANKNGVALTVAQIKSRLGQNLKGADEGEVKKVAAQAEREAASSRAAIYGEGPAAVKALKALREAIKGRVEQALLIAGAAADAVPKDLKGLTEYTTSTLPTNIALSGLKKQDPINAAKAVANARKIATESRDPETRATALAAIQAAENAILEPAQASLDRLVKRAQNPQQQAAARKAFARTIKRTYTGHDTAKGNDLIAEENRKQLDAELAAADARSARVKSETADPVAQANATARASAAKLAKVSAAYKKGLVAIDVLDNAAAANNDALRAASDARVSDAESQRSLATSQFSLEHFTDQKATLQRALTDAQAAANTIRAEGDKQSPAALRGALTAVNAAKQAIAEYARSQAQELLTANAEYAKSRTDDPVKQAEIDAKLAKDQEKFATTKAERRSAKANTNTARKNVVDTKITSREDTIDFNLTMEKITRDEAIRQLESLSKSAGITTQTRRSILTKIKALKDEGSKDTTAFNLGVGDIKLPTVYDVRRGIASVQALTRGGPATSRANGGSSSNVTANVVVNVSDANSAGAVYDAIDRALRTSVRSRMRNAGVR